MKTTKIILTIALATSGFISNAQDKTHGKISYEHTMNLHASLKPDQLQFKDMIPEFSSFQSTLSFNGAHTKTEQKEMADKETEEGATIKFSTKDDEKCAYSDGTLAGTYSLIEKDGKQALVKLDKAPKDNKDKEETEKIGKKTKNILGFECKEIIIGEMTLWVTPLLPFKSGPMKMVSEHGAILGIEVGKKMKVYATAIDYVPVKTEEVTPPAGIPIQ